MNVTTDRSTVVPPPGSLRLSNKAGRLSVTNPNGETASVVASATAKTPGASAVTNVVSLSQAAYDALGSAIDASTLYVIVG